MATILEKIQKKYPGVTDDARNIAEALAMANGISGRGANAIVDYTDAIVLYTVLYTDGLLIINENIEDRESNIAEHGEVVKEYEPLSTEQPYDFKDDKSLWYEDRSSILSVKFGSTVKPLIMSLWFDSCNACTSIDMTNLNTSNVTDMSGMFSGCGSLASLDLSGFNTSNVTNMGGMFSGCGSLASLDLSGFNTSNVTNMGGMFVRCAALTNLDLSGFNTSNVTNMGSMFSGCGSLASLDLSGFNTSNVTDMSGMFSNCSNLNTVTASGAFVTTGLAPSGSGGTFGDCSKLVGGNGTVYSSDHVNAEYARIDTEETPGYFTAASA